MTLVAPFKFVLIDLNEKEQKDLEELINLQEDDIEKTLGRKFDSKKICNIMWKHLKYIVMAGDKNTKQLKFPLNEHD